VLSAITILAGLVLVALVLVNAPHGALLAGLLLWWAVGLKPTRWAWEVFVGPDKSNRWKWGWAVALGALWPVWLILAVGARAGEDHAKER